MEYYKPETNSKSKWVIIIVLMGSFILDLWAVLASKTAFIDDRVMEFALNAREDYISTIMVFLTRSADTLVISIICIVLVVLPTRVKFGIPVAFSALIAGIIPQILQSVIVRARPDEAIRLMHETGNSFPSGHAYAGFVFYLFLMVLLRRYLMLEGNNGAANLVSVVFPLLVFIIGISRIYLGVHYPTDVIGSWLLGAITLILIVTFYDDYYPQKNRITFETPSWEYSRRRRPWRRPQVSHPAENMVDFPKERSGWKRPATTAKRRAIEAERLRRTQHGDGGNGEQ